ncbi:MAG TPA: SDR family NAD(P)-dependent oxidoreductase [Gemmatimonadales bacterium]|nr:SDR family NAD(P)-dependent oxidoreductase [Gemmatimonadales bacterium]
MDPGAAFAGKVALVTGVGQAGQIGAAIARAFGAAGARVVAAARNRATLEARVGELAASGIAAELSAGDLGDPAAARAAVATAEQRFGGLDILINTAGGLTSYGPFLESDVAALDREIASNLRTVFAMSQAAIPALRRRGGGAIVNFASIAVRQPAPNLAAYAAAKGGVAALTRALAREFRDERIRVNAIAPEAIRTDTNVRDMGAGARFVEMADVVRTVLWLASAGAAAVTGHVLPLLAAPD